MQWTPAAIAEAIERPNRLRGVLLSGAKGGFQDANGSSRGLSGPADLTWMLTNRALADLLVVSFGTAVAEHYPTRWIPRDDLLALRRSLSLPDTLDIVVISNDPARVRTAEADGFTCWSIGRLREELAQRPDLRVVCEGGPSLLAEVAGDALDEMAWSRSPLPSPASKRWPQLDLWREQAAVRWSGQQDGFEFSLLARDDSQDS